MPYVVTESIDGFSAFCLCGSRNDNLRIVNLRDITLCDDFTPRVVLIKVFEFCVENGGLQLVDAAVSSFMFEDVFPA